MGRAWRWFLNRSWPVRIVIVLIALGIVGNIFGEDDSSTESASQAGSGEATAPEEPGEPEQAAAQEQPAEPEPEPEPEFMPEPTPEPEPAPEPEELEAEYPTTTPPELADAEMTVRVGGAEGGSYRVQWASSEREEGAILDGEPDEYAFEQPEDGVNVTVSKAEQWDGPLYAFLFADGKMVACGHDDFPLANFSLTWSAYDGELDAASRAACRTHEWFS